MATYLLGGRRLKAALISSFFFWFTLTPIAKADPEVSLPPIVETGSLDTPSDALEEDPILPAKKGQIETDSGTGSLGASLQNALPFSFSATDQPGALNQVRGNGLSAEDIDVEALGVPLGSPSGGGFDLSIFPQFLWSDFRFQLGPSLAGYDLRAVTGTLNLVPWSARNLSDPESGGRATGLFSSNQLYQFSAGYHFAGNGNGNGNGSGIGGEKASAIFGYSLGNATGPALGASFELYHSDQTSIRFHLLATRLDAQLTGPALFPTPFAHQITERIIPIVQSDWKLSEATALKTSFFYDAQRLRYQDPTVPVSTSDRTQQIGAETALLFGDWKAGVSSRYVIFDQLGFNAPAQDVTNLQLSRAMDLGDGYLLSPSLQTVWISRYGAYPEESLGLRKDFNPEQALFTRASYANKFPTMVDLYYVGPFGAPNPSAQPEQDYTLIVGGEWKEERKFKLSLQEMAQWRERSLIIVVSPNFLYSKANAGEAQVLSTIGDAAVDPVSWLELGETVSYNRSNLAETGGAFPYLSEWISITYAQVEIARWQTRIRAILRSATQASADLQGDQVGGYGLVDLQASVQAFKNLQILGRIENLTGQPAQLTLGYPDPGRIFSLLLSGSF